MSDPSKKRKRAKDGNSKSSKKVALEAPEPVGSVKISVLDTETWAPVIGMLPPRLVRYCRQILC